MSLRREYTERLHVESTCDFALFMIGRALGDNQAIRNVTKHLASRTTMLKTYFSNDQQWLSLKISVAFLKVSDGQQLAVADLGRLSSPPPMPLFSRLDHRDARSLVR